MTFQLLMKTEFSNDLLNRSSDMFIEMEKRIKKMVKSGLILGKPFFFNFPFFCVEVNCGRASDRLELKQLSLSFLETP